jgi:integrase/recombinase XerD
MNNLSVDLGLVDGLKAYHKAFIDELVFTGKSEHTIKRYNQVIINFIDYSYEYDEDFEKLKYINKLFITNCLNTLQDIKSNNSKRQYISIIKNFFRFITENNEEQKDFMPIFDNNKMKIKKEETIPEHFTKEESEKIVKFVEDEFVKRKNFLSARNSFVIKILLYTGVRKSELLNLKFSDIEKIYQDGVSLYRIKVLGKGNKYRYAYIQSDIIIKEYEVLNEYKLSEYIVVSKKRQKISPSQINESVNKWLAKCLITKKGIHIFRHTFAINLVNKNINLITIKELMGHSDIQTTMIYARTNETNKIKAIL